MAIQGLLNAEVPLAYLLFALTIIVIVWKSLGRLAFLPGWDDVFGDLNAQYPRRGEGEEYGSKWVLIYIVMYGVLGSIAQYAGLQISIDSKNRGIMSPTTVSRAKRLGFFHVVIAIHHVLWSLRRDWGTLDFSNTAVPLGGYLPFGVVAAWTGFHGVKLLLTNSHTHFDQLLRSKTLVDAASCTTLIEILFFLAENWVGVRRESVEYFAWTLTVAAPLAMFAMDIVSEQGKRPVSTKKKS